MSNLESGNDFAQRNYRIGVELENLMRRSVAFRAFHLSIIKIRALAERNEKAVEYDGSSEKFLAEQMRAKGVREGVQAVLDDLFKLRKGLEQGHDPGNIVQEVLRHGFQEEESQDGVRKGSGDQPQDARVPREQRGPGPTGVVPRPAGGDDPAEGDGSLGSPDEPR